ncbi:predicted protein [Naegleria gruberi]|uniref:Predicted protein n=1 Tax=Naegleria gruberi TaxID=5762 RepID=D2W477_NAEGR|nr:uncharacterized protein NAEGRDRAFT_76206 [Naegleria gruberi]EFC36132.1 predicted protein [Naegleria gruberi]|eukprot:XP_002668876.1 predicted protein [Naegleria gruberi strain NEG-M]
MTPYETYTTLVDTICNNNGRENFGLFPHQTYCNYSKGQEASLPLSIIKPRYFEQVSEQNCKTKVGSFLTLHAYSLKYKGYSNLDETLSIQNSGKDLEIICDPALVNYVSQQFPSSKIYSSAYGAVVDCFAGSMLERFDLIIVDDYSLGPQFAGLSPKWDAHNSTLYPNSDLYLWEEWNVFPLKEIGILCLDENVELDDLKNIKLIENDFKVILNAIYLEGLAFNNAIKGNLTFVNGKNLMCSQVFYVWHFYYYFRVNRYENGFFNGISNDFSKFSSKFHLNLNETLQISESQWKFQNGNMSIFDFYISECFNCAKHRYDFYSAYTVDGVGINNCLVAPFDETFIPYLLMVILFVIYYIGLLTIYSKPSIKRRLIAPYLAPLYYIVSHAIIIGFDNTCTTITIPIQFGLTNAYSLSLIFVTLRLIISRYYYKIIARVKKEHMTAFRILFSKWIGNLIIVMLWPFGMSIAMSVLPLGYYYLMDDKFVDFTYYYYMVWWMIEVLAFGFLFILDFILNFKTLRTKGLKYYLLFDDPVFMRLDIITHLFQVFAIAPYIFESKVTFRVGSFFGFLIITLGSGGNAIAMEWFSIIKNYFRKEEESTGHGIELKMRDESYFNLIYVYSEKENNLENILCVEFLLSLENRAILEKDLNYLNDIFIQTYAMYELNISNQVKLDFLFLLDKCRNGEVVKFSDLDVLMIEVMKNVRDIANRLETTDFYRQWKRSTDVLKGQVDI